MHTRIAAARMTSGGLVMRRLAIAVTMAWAVPAFAQDPSPAPAAPAAAPASASAAATKPEPGGLKPFQDVIKGAKEHKGFFTLYQKDEKVWLAIKPEQLDKSFFFTVNIPRSIGERGLYASQMGQSYTAAFKRIGNQIQLLAKNVKMTAAPGTPEALVVSQAFSDSLLSAAPVVSAPEANSKAFLVELNSLLLSDIPMYSTRLEYAYRMNFGMDKGNSNIESIYAQDDLSGVLVNALFAVPRISAPPMMPPPVPLPTPPKSVPDPRSFFVGFYYSFAKLPEVPMVPRVADDRVGHFVTANYDFSDDRRSKTVRYFVNHWRLEKQDPNAELSEPKKPITYWLDKNIPEKYRKAVADGVLEWNKAFEKIGFKNAVVVKQQTDKDTFDTMDAAHASIRWFVGADVGFAIGPSKVDQRSGEILDADIGMSDVFARGIRRTMTEETGHAMSGDDACQFANQAGAEMDFALDVMQMRDGLEPDDPKVEAVAQAYVKDVIMHEVGHTLGLRHNFRASTIYTLKQLADPEFTKAHGLAGSVMDYLPINLSLKGEMQGDYVMSTLGPYDYWAIEYAYKPFAAEQEANGLAAIAARSTEPLLAFGTDEDSSDSVSDPDVNVFDMGVDPLAFFQRRLALSRELWDRLQAKKLKQGESYETLRRSFANGFAQFSRAIAPAVKYVGGATVLRDHAGSGRASVTPVAAERQRQALKMISGSLFSSKSFVFSPEFLSHLGNDYFEQAAVDKPVSQSLLKLQTMALDHLMSDGVASRLLGAQEKVRDPKQLLSLGELYDQVQNAIWSELGSGEDISGARRNLQREHLKRLAADLLKPGPMLPADARSLLRENAVRLQAKLQAAQGRAQSRESRAHLQESLSTLNEVLKAPIIRSGI